MEKYILTGGPGTGKSTQAKLLTENGYVVVPEAAREVIIREQEKAKSFSKYYPILPWTDMTKFQEHIIHQQIYWKNKLNTDAFLDRSLVDNFAYSTLHNVDLPRYAVDLVNEAGYSKVFLLEQIPYEQDSVRKESFEEATRIHEQLRIMYGNFGFEIISVPDIGKQQRLEFILRHIEDDAFTPYSSID